MTASNDWQPSQSDDWFWTRDSAAAQAQTGPAGPEYTGYGYYGQQQQQTATPAPSSRPAATAEHAQPAPEWVQPGAGYAQPPTHSQLTPYQGAHFYGPTLNHPSGAPALVLGILGMSVFPPLGYIALILGIRGRNEAKANPGVYANEGMLTAGIILGALASAISTFLILVVLFVVLAAASY